MLYTDQTEAELLCSAIEGDYLAFEALHDLLEPPIRRFIRRLVGQDADDIVQDTFIAFYLNMHRIRPDENLRPYIFRIARNRCYDLLRRQGRFEHISLDDEPAAIRISFDLASHSIPPEEVTHWLLLSLEVQEAMEHLPEMQRQTLILYCEEGMSYAEIAAVMEVSLGTVKSRLFHAKKTLRGLLNPETLAAINDEIDR